MNMILFSAFVVNTHFLKADLVDQNEKYETMAVIKTRPATLAY